MNYNPQYEYCLIDHFLNSQDGDINFINTTTGGTLSSAGGTALHPGIMQVSSVSASTDRGYIRSNSNCILFGGGSWVYQAVVRTPALSTAAQEFVVECGFFDTVTGADAIDGVYFEYDRATGGDFWRTATSSNSVRTKNTTGIAIAAGTFYYLKIVISETGNQAEFYINDVLQFTHTTNIPTGAGRTTGVSTGAYKTVGTSAVDMLDIDLVWVYHKLTTPLW